MKIQKTDKIKDAKSRFSSADILSLITSYLRDEVPHMDLLWRYFEGDDTKVQDKPAPDPNNPDHRIPVPYGRKIVNTFTGYAYRPKYTTYKQDVDEHAMFAETMKSVFKINQEHIKTSRGARNMAIFGVSYELVYFDAMLDTNSTKGPKMVAVPKFCVVDPRELIVLHDNSMEPKKVAAIRFVKAGVGKYDVEVYYAAVTDYFVMSRDDNDGEWHLTPVAANPSRINYFGSVPVAAFYFGDEMTGVIDPVLPLIDAYDLLMSDSMNEFDRFAYAYLIMKKFGLTDMTKKKEPGMVDSALKLLKRRRVFENVPAEGDVKFLTKNIPTEFITFMAGALREQIHVQSHVPDFTSEKMAGASGIAIKRLLFDFENVVSSTEADFDVGLNERMALIAIALKKMQKADGFAEWIVISHKRNLPTDLAELATTALSMKNAGFSRRTIVNIMPDDVIPDKEQELKWQDEDYALSMPDITQYDENGNPIDQGVPTDQNQAVQ